MLDEAKRRGIVSKYTNLLTAFAGCKNHEVPYFTNDIYAQTLTEVAGTQVRQRCGSDGGFKQLNPSFDASVGRCLSWLRESIEKSCRQ